MLGITRDVSNDKGRVECTMTAFVDGMAKAFDDHLPKEEVRTPFPDHVFTSQSPYVKKRKPGER